MVTEPIDPSRYRITADAIDLGTIDLDKEAVYAPDGHRVTEAETEAFTLSRGGRPSLSGERRNSPVLGVRLAPAERIRLDQAAEAAGVSASEIVRRALTAWLDGDNSQTQERRPA